MLYYVRFSAIISFLKNILSKVHVPFALLWYGFLQISWNVCPWNWWKLCCTVFIQLMFEVTLSSSLHSEGVLTRALVSLSVGWMKILFIVSAPPKSRYLLTKVQGLAKLKAFDSEGESFRYSWSAVTYVHCGVSHSSQPFLQSGSWGRTSPSCRVLGAQCKRI